VTVDVGAIRTAMALALEAVGELDVNAYVKAQPVPPGIQILPPEIEHDATFGGVHGVTMWVFTVQGYVGIVDEIAPQQLLDDLIRPGGVKAALEADRTLGGLVASLRVESNGPPRQVESSAGFPMLLVEWRVSMYVQGE